ncbi:MAG: hypothetical protein J6Q77_04205 [Clostridia bacterium]|nr:hypothetical protein [Clostridia bacterium]
MSKYIITLISLSVFSGVIHMLVPESSGDRLRGQIKLVTALCVLCIAIAPLAGLLKDIGGSDFDFFSKYTDKEDLEMQYEDIFKDSVGRYTAQDVARRSEELVCEKFGLDEEDLSIRASVSELEGRLSVDSATVMLYSGAIMTDPREIAEYLESLLECECEIVYG